MSNVTRRSFPALLAGLAGSLATTAAAEPSDPIFAALDAYAQARAECSMAHDHLDALQKAHADVAFYRPRAPMGTHTTLAVLDGEQDRTETLYAYNEAEIGRFFSGRPDRAAKIADRIAALDQDRARSEEARKSLGITAAEAAADAASDRLYEAEVVVLETVPTTTAGARALAQFAAHALEERGEGEDTLAPLRGLFAFLTRAA